jgi:hypothetical protein
MDLLRRTACCIFVFVLVLFAGAVYAAEGESSTNAGDPSTETRANPHLDRTVELIRSQVGWFGEKPTSYSLEFLYTVATMNYVQSRVSPLEYSRLVQNQQKLPVKPEGYLSTGAGICGGQVMTAREILDRLEIRNRPVEFYLQGAVPAKNQSHIGVEVFYADEWHFFDITWGTFFRHDGVRADDVLPISALLKTKNVVALAVTNSSDLWYQQWTAAGLDPFEYLKVAEKDVIVGRNGIVHLRPEPDAKKGFVYTPTHQPNYVGRNSRSADSGSLAFRLQGVSEESRKCTIAISGVAGAGQLVVQAKSGKTQMPLAKLEAGDHELDLAGLASDDSLLITVSPAEPRGIGYVVIKQISLE